MFSNGFFFNSRCELVAQTLVCSGYSVFRPVLNRANLKVSVPNKLKFVLPDLLYVPQLEFIIK